VPVTLTQLLPFYAIYTIHPQGVILDSAGDLIGATADAGTGPDGYGQGTVYELTYADGSYAATPTVLVAFNGTDGSQPEGTLVADANGDLFGVTQAGGEYYGTVYEIPYVDGSYASTPVTLFNYQGAFIGTTFPVSSLNGGLAIDATGDLFGTTESELPGSGGSIFEIPFVDGAYAATLTTLFTFTNGQSPADATPVMDAAGDFFGATVGAATTSQPGDGSGTVYELPYIDGSYASTPTILATFPAGAEYADPQLTMDAAGDIFGSADEIIFEIPKTSTGYGPLKTIATSIFTTVGFYIDPSGNIFGVNDGLIPTIFEIPNTGSGYGEPITIEPLLRGFEPSSLYGDGRGNLFLTGLFYESSEMLEVSGIPCYCRGTLILTDRGERRVEELVIGDWVLTAAGAAKPIRWIGRRGYDGRFIRGNRNVLPVVISAGALGDGVPARDLWVSPEHALYIDRLLVPARLLVNGLTIVQVEAVDRVEYFHIELDAHDVILAEGMPAETYLDCGNRLMFRNAAEYGAGASKGTAGRSCALRIGEGAAAAGIRRRLLARAVALGHRLTADAGLHLIVDGVALWPTAAADETYRFSLARPPGEVWLTSRSAVAAETDAASRDRRRLGVSLRRIALRGSNWAFDLPLDSPQLREGFHPQEGNHRWTDGMARLPAGMLALLRGKVEIEIALWPSQLRYVEPAVSKSQNVADTGSPKFARAA
jgi:hypothetical protein